MARQSATQHLALLEAANLISTAWQGRAKLHYLNPVPIYEIHERWIDKFEVPRLQALSRVKQRAEEHDMSRKTFVYVTYIRATPETVWRALTDADLSAEYWGHRNVSDWLAGSHWEHQRTDGSAIADVVGTVLETMPPRRLVITFEAPGEEASHVRSKVSFDIQPYHDIVRLTVTQDELAEDAFAAAAAGWPAVMANLKSLLETGNVLPQAPWEMYAELRAAQMARNDSRRGAATT
jgi:uncharacterized protein YndB with AHSA1/START domain